MSIFWLDQPPKKLIQTLKEFFNIRLDKMKTKELKVSAFLEKPLPVEDLVKVTRKVFENQRIPLWKASPILTIMG